MKAHIKRFEDLEAWQLSRELTNQIYTITKNGPIARDYGFRDQIRRAAISIMNNIAEGFERGSNKDFVKFLFIAKGSAGEVRSLLYVSLDQSHITETAFAECRDLCIRSSQVIWALIRGLRRRVDFITGMRIIIAAAFIRLGLTGI
jgi:four helix bundle protein